MYDRCRKSNVQHAKRHREIASLVQDILNLDDARAGTSPSLHKTRKARKGKALESLMLDTGFPGEGTEPEEWLDTSTVYDDDLDGQISGPAEKKENMDLKKTPKAERKPVKIKSQFQVTTAEELERTQDALHPARESNWGGGYLESNSLTNNATIHTNIAFNSNTFQYSSLRSAVQQKKLEKSISTPRSRTPLDDSQMLAILHRLGISTGAVSHGSKERKSCLARLRIAIENDLLCVENEYRETIARMAGYWRYANRRTYNAMVRNNELWDWATGAKLEEIEEEEEDERELDGADDEDQRSPPFSESDTFIGTPQPEIWDDDFLFESNDPLRLASASECIVEQRSQMYDNQDVDLAKKFPSVIAEGAPVLATPVKTAAWATKKGNTSPWAGIKDTRRHPRRSTSPPSPRKRYYPRAPSPPRRVLSIKNITSNRPRKYVPAKASVAAPTARSRKSISTKLADLHLPKFPKNKIPPRNPENLISFASIVTTSACKLPRVDSAAENGVPVNIPFQVFSDSQDDDTIPVPTTEVHANSNASVAEPFHDPNNRFSLLM